MKYTFYPKGTCSYQMNFNIEDGIILEAEIIGGCPGNTTGLVRLIKGMNVDEVIEKLDGITCGARVTSCPDQLSRALREFKAHNCTEKE